MKSSRRLRRARILARLSSTMGARAAWMSASLWTGSSVSSSLSAATSSAMAWGPLPVSTMALPIQKAAPWGSAPLSIRWSTTTLGRGTSEASTPSMPSRRQMVRSTATVVQPSIKRWVSSATRAAWARACSTSLKSRFSLDSNNNHFHSRFQSKAGGSGPLSKQRPAWEYSLIIPRDGSAYDAPGWRAPWTTPGRAPGRPHP